MAAGLHSEAQARERHHVELPKVIGDYHMRDLPDENVKALDELNEALYQSCVTCHLHYRPNYGRGR